MNASPPPALTPLQEQIALALASGASIAAAARGASITRQTIHNWLHQNPQFSRTVQDLRAAHIQSIRERVSRLSDRALTALDRMLESPTTPPSVLLRAALAVLNRSVKLENGWVLPMQVESPKIQQSLDLIDEIRQDQSRKDIPAAMEGAGFVPPQTPEPAPDLTQFDTFPEKSVPPPPVHVQIPRNAPCPCGSGQKYKRCCGRAAPPLVFRAA